MYLYDSQKLKLVKMGNLVIKKSEDYYRIDEYGKKKSVYYLCNDGFIIGVYKTEESARKTLEEIIKENFFKPTFMFEINDDFKDIVVGDAKCHG